MLRQSVLLREAARKHRPPVRRSAPVVVNASVLLDAVILICQRFEVFQQRYKHEHGKELGWAFTGSVSAMIQFAMRFPDQMDARPGPGFLVSSQIDLNDAVIELVVEDAVSAVGKNIISEQRGEDGTFMLQPPWTAASTTSRPSLFPCPALMASSLSLSHRSTRPALNYSFHVAVTKPEPFPLVSHFTRQSPTDAQGNTRRLHVPCASVFDTLFATVDDCLASSLSATAMIALTQTQQALNNSGGGEPDAERLGLTPSRWQGYARDKRHSDHAMWRSWHDMWVEEGGLEGLTAALREEHRSLGEKDVKAALLVLDQLLQEPLLLPLPEPDLSEYNPNKVRKTHHEPDNREVPTKLQYWPVARSPPQ
ncbi:hypothetical protein JCM10213v2_001511 [Rhodosporidiobolus nylandii]